MNVISSSYGNDSMALIQWAKETSLPDVTVAYCHTGWSAPWWPQRVDKGEALAKSYGFKVVRCESMGMAELVRQRKGWPGNGLQFCTTHLKMIPFLNWNDLGIRQACAPSDALPEPARFLTRVPLPNNQVVPLGLGDNINGL